MDLIEIAKHNKKVEKHTFVWGGKIFYEFLFSHPGKVKTKGPEKKEKFFGSIMQWTKEYK